MVQSEWWWLQACWLRFKIKEKNVQVNEEGSCCLIIIGVKISVKCEISKSKGDWKNKNSNYKILHQQIFFSGIFEIKHTKI